MTWNPGRPAANESPGLWPSQSQGNNTRLEDVIDAEHVFPDSSAANEGCHKQMTTISRADPVSLPAGTNGMFYEDTDTLPAFYDGVSKFRLGPVRALVTFNQAGVIQGSSFNATVTGPSSGIYTITFPKALPSANFQHSLQCRPASPFFPLMGVITGITLVGSTVTEMTVRFVRTDDGQVDTIITGNLIIIGG